MKKGTRWVYRDTVNEYSDVAGDAVELNGEKVVPVVTYLDGRKAETTFYLTTPKGLFIAAYDLKKPLPSPIPVFKTGEKSWTFSGLTQWLGGMSSIEMKGSCSLKGKRKALGKDVETLEVRLEAKIGGAEGGTMSVKQIATYGKGIGMVKMDQINIVAGKEQKSTVELVSMELPKDLR